ncbi:MAG: Do family serine endopeptidase [Desulfobacterales bacterium]|nr:Do family serine endopeptidase [Desulfobacterales bacterium]
MQAKPIFRAMAAALLVAVLVWVPQASAEKRYERKSAVVQAVKKVSPAVVNISTQYEVRYRRHPFARFGMDDFFRDFFDSGPERKRELNSLGSGVIIDGEHGYILTNSHVIVKSGKVSAVLKDGREFSAEIVGADPESDLAVLQIETKEPLPAIEMGNSDDLMIGETVIAIGNPFGFSHTVTTGVISAVNRSFKAEDRVFRDFIQTDASINPGNSGGPLLNINGELIGVNTAIYRNAEGIGFAIPINRARKIVSDLIAYGEVIHAWIGLFVQDLDRNMADYFDLETGTGVAVQNVAPDSPADQAGIREGDIVLSIHGEPIKSISDYKAAMRGFGKGDRIRVKVRQKGTQKQVDVKAKLFPERLAPRLARRLLGIDVVDISEKSRFDGRISADSGVIISEVDSQSKLGRIGAEPGDVIRKIDEIRTGDIQAFYDAIIKYRWKDSVVILLQRGNQGFYFTVDL